MVQQMLDYECAIYGHLIGVAGNANEASGRYVCQRCRREVPVGCKLQEVKE